MGVTSVSWSDAAYPNSLKELRDPPRQLYAIGEIGALSVPHERVVAIVGTREASPYGIRVAQALGRAFADAGAVVVSGMARGVDSAAHQGALATARTGARAVGGLGAAQEARTVAVLGTGPDVPYPAGNRALHGDLAERGLVVSESRPGTKAFQGCFPRRNRIIAALARLTIVVEAGHKSGALNTASQALELGRLVAAVPGPIDDPRAAGSNTLLRDGAQVVTTIDDALGLLGLSRNKPAARPELGIVEAEVWDVVKGGGVSADAISAASGCPIREVLAAVAKLELLGLVTVEDSGTVRALGLTAMASSDMLSSGPTGPKSAREDGHLYRSTRLATRHNLVSSKVLQDVAV